MMKIFLSETLKAQVDRRLLQEGDGASGEHSADPTREETDRGRLGALLRAGVGSEPGIKADSAYFEGLRTRLRSLGEDFAAT